MKLRDFAEQVIIGDTIHLAVSISHRALPKIPAAALQASADYLSVFGQQVGCAEIPGDGHSQEPGMGVRKTLS